MNWKSYVVLSETLVVALGLTNAEVSAQSFYPLHSGNTWCYRDTTFGFGFPGSADTSIVSVRGDTTINGTRYSLIDGLEAIGGRFLRTDSAWVYYWNPFISQEVPFFRLSADSGDSWNVNYGRWFFVRCFGRENEVFLGQNTEIIGYHLDGLAQMVVFLSDRFGPIDVRDYYDPPGSTITLREVFGARIAGTTYGHVLAVNATDQLPIQIDLNPNYPNPFNPTTTISLQLPSRSEIVLEVVDIGGRAIDLIFSGRLEAGEHSFQWSAAGRASGVYFTKLRTPNTTLVRKMLLLR